MSTLIVYCHPYEQSFCHAMLDALRERYDREGTPYQIIDLHADGFDPVLSRDELAVYGEGAALDPLVTRYQELIAGSDRLFLIAFIFRKSRDKSFGFHDDCFAS